MTTVSNGLKSQGHTPCEGLQVFIVLECGTRYHCVACKKSLAIDSAKLDHMKVHLCGKGHNHKMRAIVASLSVGSITSAVTRQQAFVVKPANVVTATFEATTSMAFQKGGSMTAAAAMSTAVARFAGSLGTTSAAAIASMAKSKNPVVNKEEAEILSKILSGIEEQKVLSSAEKAIFKQTVRKLQKGPSQKERLAINQGLNVVLCVNQMAEKVKKNQNPAEMRALASRTKATKYVQYCLLCACITATYQSLLHTHHCYILIIATY